MKAINLEEKYKKFSKQWHPHLIDEGKNLQVYVSKIQGDFIMHTHENTDEFFLVVKGNMEMCFKNNSVPVIEGEVILIPAGIAHCPRTINGEEVSVLVIESKGTKHTGNIIDNKTVKNFERI